MKVEKFVLLLILLVGFHCLTVDHQLKEMNHKMRKTQIIGKSEGTSFDFPYGAGMTIVALAAYGNEVITNVVFGTVSSSR